MGKLECPECGKLPCECKCVVCRNTGDQCHCDTKDFWLPENSQIEVTRNEGDEISRVMLCGYDDDFDEGGTHGRGVFRTDSDQARMYAAEEMIRAGMFLAGGSLAEMAGSVMFESQMSLLEAMEGLRPQQKGGLLDRGLNAGKKEDPKRMKEGKKRMKGKGDGDDEKTPPSHLTGKTKSVLAQGGIPPDWIRYFDVMSGYARTLNNPYGGDAVGLARSYMRKPGTEERFQQWLNNHPAQK